jgi:SAM-dependent methyltransferase
MSVNIISISPGEPLEITGERCSTAPAEEVKHEHYHRYFFALQFCKNKEVLEIGSAEGYGSALLGMVAQHVFGVDASPEAVARASRNYRSARVSFIVGHYAAIPLSDASVDVVVSFEALELLEIGEHALQVLSAEAGTEELIPEPFAIEAQAESLSGPLAVKLMEFAHRLGPTICLRPMEIWLAHGWDEF